MFDLKHSHIIQANIHRHVYVHVHRYMYMFMYIFMCYHQCEKGFWNVIKFGILEGQLLLSLDTFLSNLPDNKIHVVVVVYSKFLSNFTVTIVCVCVSVCLSDCLVSTCLSVRLSWYNQCLSFV